MQLLTHTKVHRSHGISEQTTTSKSRSPLRREILNRIVTVPFCYAITFCAILVSAIFATGYLNHSTYNDENFYNPLVRYYAEGPVYWPLTDTTLHPISIGPFFFQGHRLWSGLFGAGDHQARSFSSALMVLACLAWTAIASKLYREELAFLIGTFWLLPFHGVFATCTLAEPFMLAFLLLSVYCWILAVDRDHDANGRSAAVLYCLCGVFLGLAQNAKQPLLVLSLGFVLFGAIRLRSRWSVLGPLIAILIQLPFWIRWGNIFPPGQRFGMMPQFADMSGLFPDSSMHLLTVCGVALWPALKIDFKSVTTWGLLFAGLTLWIVCGPDLNPNSEYRYRFVGPMLQLSLLGPIVRWAMILPFLAGWMLFCDSMRHIYRGDVDLSRQLLMFFSVIAVIGFMRSPLAFDRYVACFLPLWLMAYWPEMKRSPTALRWCMLMLAMQTIVLFERVWNQQIQFPSPVAYLGV